MDRTERLLRMLFDFQRFAGNERLSRVICAADGAGAGMALDDCELELNAAGNLDMQRLSAKEKAAGRGAADGASARRPEDRKKI